VVMLLAGQLTCD